jgi:hypothetical protein
MPKAKAAPLERRTIAVSIRLFREIRQRAGRGVLTAGGLAGTPRPNKVGDGHREQDYLQSDARKREPMVPMR